MPFAYGTPMEVVISTLELRIQVLEDTIKDLVGQIRELKEPKNPVTTGDSRRLEL